jgi:CRP/FNR family transcriptional regulator, cyclic AMP receptor protein
MQTIDVLKNDPDLRELIAGEILFARGDEAHQAFVIVEGELEIVVNDIVIDVANEGGIVGEMALIDDAPRSATVRATKPTKVAVINESRFAFMIQQTPFFAIKVMRIMSERLRKMLDAQANRP